MPINLELALQWNSKYGVTWYAVPSAGYSLRHYVDKLLATNFGSSSMGREQAERFWPWARRMVSCCRFKISTVNMWLEIQECYFCEIINYTECIFHILLKISSELPLFLLSGASRTTWAWSKSPSTARMNYTDGTIAHPSCRWRIYEAFKSGERNIIHWKMRSILILCTDGVFCIVFSQ
jgi:hypothetical protein